jgi:hypothetical protein
VIPLVFHLSSGWWDNAIVKFILSGVNHFEIIGLENVQIDGPVAVICIPGRHSVEHYDQINDCAARFAKVIFFVCGDEEGVFQIDRLQHSNKIVWFAMPPFVSQSPDRTVVNGWPSEAMSLIAQVGDVKRIHPISLYGQDTHTRRHECFAAAANIPGAKLLRTPGFTQGVPREEYYRVMRQSKLVACPGGPCTPDSFRFSEALESGAIPIADDLCARAEYPSGYWRYVFQEDKLPFPIVSNWEQLSDVAREWLPRWEELQPICMKWWSAKKMSWIKQMREDLHV